MVQSKDGDFSLMKKDKWIYTFNQTDVKSAGSLTDLWNLVKNCSEFSSFIEKNHLTSFFDKHPELMLNALAHTSFTHENQQLNALSNERLEFLGDAFLDAEISVMLWDKFPELKEGELSKFRSSLVNEDVLSLWGRILKLDSFILLGKGESERSEVEAAIIADALEALIGAMGLIERESLPSVLMKWIELFDTQSVLSFFNLKRLDLFDPKTKLQEYTLELYKEVPVYQSEAHEELGFECSLYVKGKFLGQGKGKNKKKAEMAAAKKVLIEEKYKNII